MRNVKAIKKQSDTTSYLKVLADQAREQRNRRKK